jgi:hypothetical protein
LGLNGQSNWPDSLWGEREGVELQWDLGRKLKKNRNYDFEVLASGMEGFKWNFEFE